jgi:hypothetical protein
MAEKWAKSSLPSPPNPISLLSKEAGISKNYGATKSGSPEVEARFCSCSYCSNSEQVGLTPDLFFLSLLCVSLVMANE